MSNMSYCRFYNTLPDLVDCCEHIDDPALSAEEYKARERLIKTCAKILNTFGKEVEVEDILDGLWDDYENKEDCL